jgi:phosphoserine phosphatase
MRRPLKPEQVWRNLLKGCTNRIFAFDLDATLWLPDILVGLNEAFGPTDLLTGKKRWLMYDRAYKVTRTMTNGQHLLHEYKDLFELKTLDELIAWLKENLHLVPNAREFMNFLRRQRITPVAITNGAGQIASVMQKHLNVEMPTISNSLVFDDEGKMTGVSWFHNEDDGVRKGDLIELAAQWGFEIVGCAGDSKGDFGMAEATAKHGGLIIAVGFGGLTDWCFENEGQILKPTGWIRLDNYADALSAMQQRLAGS